MYIQVTDRCNMRCDHCCMSSSRSRNSFMERSVFERAVEVAEDYGMSLTIGGGEPTLHPLIFEFLHHVMRSYSYGRLEVQPFMVTNGKNYKMAKKVYSLTQPDDDYGMYPVYAYNGEILEFRDEPSIRIELSTDYYHETVDSRITELYRRSARRKDQGAGVRDVTTSLRGVMGIGRALKNGIADYKKDDCACETLFISPDGGVYSCGCKKHRLGDIWDIEDIMQWYDENCAHFGGREMEES